MPFERISMVKVLDKVTPLESPYFLHEITPIGTKKKYWVVTHGDTKIEEIEITGSVMEAKYQTNVFKTKFLSQQEVEELQS
jgi:hypothetical protein